MKENITWAEDREGADTMTCACQECRGATAVLLESPWIRFPPPHQLPLSRVPQSNCAISREKEMHVLSAPYKHTALTFVTFTSPLSLHRSSYHRCGPYSVLGDRSILWLTASGKYYLPPHRKTTSAVSFSPHWRPVRHMRGESAVSARRFSTDAPLWFPDMWHMALRMMDVEVPVIGDKLIVEDEECLVDKTDIHPLFHAVIKIQYLINKGHLTCVCLSALWVCVTGVEAWGLGDICDHSTALPLSHPQQHTTALTSVPSLQASRPDRLLLS